MKRRIILACLLAAIAAGCAPAPVAISYRERLEAARSHCYDKRGDEFTPYGGIAWYAAISGNSKPMVFRCRRMEKHWKRTLAVYAFRVEGDRVVMEVR